jgi:hypothetical protein
MDDQPTCGKGLAENAALPARLGDLTAAVAAILEHHMKALDVTDDRSIKEQEVYRQLAQRHRNTAAQLHETAKLMASFRDLPMGRHHFQVMAAPEASAVFDHFVTLEEELVAFLQQRVKQDRAMLAAMRSAAN